MVELAVGREVFRKHVGDGASHTCHPDGQLPRSPPDSPRLGWQHQWVSNACLLVKIVTHSWCRFWSHFLVQRNTAEAIFKPNLLQTLGGGRRRRRRGLKEVLVRVSGENKSSSICIRMSLQPALVQCACKGGERVGRRSHNCCRLAGRYRQTANCSWSGSRPGFPFSSVWPGWCLGSMGSLLSALSSWRPTLGAGTYTVLGDTNGLFERYLTEPGTSSSSVAVPSLAELPSLIVAQLLPESAAASSRGSAVTRVWPRVSPQLPSRRQQECNLTLHFSPYQCLIGSLRVEQGGLPHRAVEVHGGVLFGGRHHFCEDFQV